MVCPAWLVRAREGIRKVLFSETPMTMIERYRADFAMLNKNIDPLTMDDFCRLVCGGSLQEIRRLQQICSAIKQTWDSFGKF